ncbi:fanconi anemia group M protein [Fistulifera solaris]|uniref:Fanconi anemia group M protein n=1 Tax=Fistulifera solaris TaxID=1519565 RepID=A0A1Z5KAV8_FISSO|nr:fanconi anemia group M protein [Fistulifera solaris]|eukprot:GAX23403.1 fanconi anemia group M protein [Fistulifera solaris]
MNSKQQSKPEQHSRTQNVLQATATSGHRTRSVQVSDTQTLSEGEPRQLPPNNNTICQIFLPRTNLSRPTNQQRQPIPFTPGPVPLDLSSSKEWIFPVDDDFPKRDYQLEISDAAIHENTLVSLPTGLGKTLIAAVVMYNYYRFFPRGKILFLAPTLPLVNQQVQACFSIMGIPETDTAVLTGKINASRRAELWNEKRVFYCTPQTIQFDLEASRCNPDYFVCVVLDEAHRATGNHSYVTIVNRLFESNAKFRLLGLSATPGKTIKDIQAVIDVLRISKIEARTEDDASIAKYIHDRAVEEVLVPNVSVAKDVEKMLNDLLLLQLDRLRARGALSGNLDYQYITSHQLRKIQECLPDTSLSGIFHIATTLCDLRTKVHVNGLACVHSVMKRLLSTRHTGPMSPFLRSEEFLKVWNVVENGKDAVANNPKLMKLREILTEHFERDRAIGRSSRSIVFSQFRDSVSEIVSTLQTCSPLIRPRHFIGQGNRTKGTEGQLQGMNQAEQQEVIRQFRSDVFNVLVCTSIGEEGLDIGEVDLIVNYDVVRSAIRSIQRIGRTGRKRDGRVVVLVSEGQEKKSYDSSKHSVGTLARALKSNKFKVNVGELLFPMRPVVCEKKMAVANSFRSSQVEGHEGAKKRGRDASLDDKTENVMSSEWKLSASQQEYVSGLTLATSVPDCPTCERIPRDLSRRFVTGRRLSFSRNDKRNNTRGRTTFMLNRFESIHGTDDFGGQKSRSLPSKLTSDFKYKTFPLKILEEDAHVDFDNVYESKMHTWASDHERDDFKPPSRCPERSKLSSHNLYQGAFENIEISGSGCQNKILQDPKNSPDPPISTVPKTQHHIKRNPYASVMRTALQNSNYTVHATDPTGHVTQKTFESNPCFANNPVKRVGSLDVSVPTATKYIMVPATTTSGKFEEGHSQNVDFCRPLETATKKRSPLQKGSDDIVTRGLNLAAKENNQRENQETARSSLRTFVEYTSNRDPRSPIEQATVQIKYQTSASDIAELNDGFNLPEDEFVLPSQSDCSSSSNEDTEHRDMNSDLAKKTITSTPERFTRKSEFSLPSPASSCSASSTDQIVGTSKRSGNPTSKTLQHSVPTPNVREQPVVENAAHGSLTPEELLIFTRENKYRKRRATFDATQSEGDESVEKHSPEDPPSEESKAQDKSVVEDIAQYLGTPDEEIVFAKANKYRKRRAIFDATQCADDASIKMQSPQDPLIDTPPLRDLTNTQEPQVSGTKLPTDEIVCVICLSGDSPDEDPIVLCDGYCHNKACNVSVHTTCYSIPASFRDEDEWRCDPCDFRHKGRRNQAIFCLTCGKGDGALKRVDGNIFHHLRCAPEPTAPTNGVRRKEKQEDHDDAHRRSNMDRRRAVRKFFDEEAGIDSDEDMDGDLSEEEQIEAIEDEEADISGFINDTSQLGYTQDELDRLGVDAYVTRVHQELDNMRTRAQQFMTPILNRRMRDAKGRESLGSPDSAKGLGNMHFIRSVLEHHRQGGNADEIEDEYNQMMADASPDDEDSPALEPSSKKVIYYESSDADEEQSTATK